MLTFTGKDGVATYRAIALKHGIKLYADTGMRPSRGWTPTAMLRTAGHITGKTYRIGSIAQYRQAIDDLQAWIDANGTSGSE